MKFQLLIIKSKVFVVNFRYFIVELTEVIVKFRFFIIFFNICS